MRGVRKLLPLIVLVFSASSALAEDPFRVGGVAGREKIAVQRFLARSPEAQTLASELQTGLGGGLEFSMLYDLTPEAAFLEPTTSPSITSGPPVKCQNWKQIGADYLVQGMLDVTPEAVRVTYRVYDVVKCSAKGVSICAPPWLTSRIVIG